MDSGPRNCLKMVEHPVLPHSWGWFLVGLRVRDTPALWSQPSAQMDHCQLAQMPMPSGGCGSLASWSVVDTLTNPAWIYSRLEGEQRDWASVEHSRGPASTCLSRSRLQIYCCLSIVHLSVPRLRRMLLQVVLSRCFFRTLNPLPGGFLSLGVCFLSFVSFESIFSPVGKTAHACNSCSLF